MSRQLILLTSALLLSPFPALAQLSSTSVQWTGTVSPRCELANAGSGILQQDTSVASLYSLSSTATGGAPAYFTSQANVPVTLTLTTPSQSGGTTIPGTVTVATTTTTRTGTSLGGGSVVGTAGISGPPTTPTISLARGAFNVAYNMTATSTELIPTGTYTFSSTILLHSQF
jgi:hypothetical protein